MTSTLNIQIQINLDFVNICRANRQKATELRNEAARCRELAERKRLKVLEKERESQRMHQEAVRVEHHADKLKRDRARSLEVIASKTFIFI